MLGRTITVDGHTWTVYPSGLLTQYVGDEFGVLFVRGEGDAREVRVTRFSPMGRASSTSREQALADLADAELVALWRMSQSGERSPEAGYRA
jgi:hypothetical protein